MFISKMALIQFTFTVIFFVVCIESQLIDIPPCSTISGDGFACTDNCRTLVRCITNGSNSVTQQNIRSCSSTPGYLCNPSNRDCSAQSCEDGSYYSQPLTCGEAGKFPHPWLCTRYYTCPILGSVISPVSCPTGTAYNGAGGNCTKESVTKRSCTDSPLGIDRCRSVDEIGAYPDDPNIFYVCAYNSYGYLLPQLRKCKAKYEFDDDEGRCVPAGAAAFQVSLLLMVLPGLISFVKR